MAAWKINTPRVLSYCGCNLEENNFLFQFGPITQGGRKRNQEKETQLGLDYRHARANAAACANFHPVRVPPASAMTPYRLIWAYIARPISVSDDNSARL